MRTTSSSPPNRDEILAQRPVLNLVAAAAYLGVSVQFMRNRVADKTLPAHRVGRLIRVYVDDLDALRQPVGGEK